MSSNTVGRYSYGTLTAINNSVTGQVIVVRDGQSASAYAKAQYSGYAVGDRVTVVTVGTQMYATGKI